MEFEEENTAKIHTADTSISVSKLDRMFASG